jgi:hypothetical protein
MLGRCAALGWHKYNTLSKSPRERIHLPISPFCHCSSPPGALPDLQHMKLLLFCCGVVGTEVGILFGAIKPDL